MTKFQFVPVADAVSKTATGWRARVVREYLGYLESLQPGQAGRLEATKGESIGAIRRRLGAAAKASGKNLTIKRTGSEVYFWLSDEAPRRRRGRPRKTQAS